MAVQAHACCSPCQLRCSVPPSQSPLELLALVVQPLREPTPTATLAPQAATHSSAPLCVAVVALLVAVETLSTPAAATAAKVALQQSPVVQVVPLLHLAALVASAQLELLGRLVATTLLGPQAVVEAAASTQPMCSTQVAQVVQPHC